MMFAKLILITLNLLLMLNYICLAQQEEFSSTVTETSSTEFSTESPFDETNSMFTTCDFDLENIEDLLQYLPDICAEIYNNQSDGLYNLYLEESKSFAKFYTKLNDYELRNQTQDPLHVIEMSEYPFETELRKDIYNKVDWALCVTNANSSVADYLNCVKEKHLDMANLIPSADK